MSANQQRRVEQGRVVNSTLVSCKLSRTESDRNAESVRSLRVAPRGGLTLVFVVTMIALFLLMGATFVVVSNDYFRSARKRSRQHLYVTDATAHLERAFYDLARGPSLGDTSSPLRGHSLLADMYGYGSFASVATAAVDSSQHFIAVTLNPGATRVIDGSPVPPPVAGELNGLLFSVVSGPAKGITLRIIDHQVSSAGGGNVQSLILMPSRLEDNFSVSQATALVNSRVLINGRPFSGTGAGHYNPFTARGSAALSQSALNPNQVGRSQLELLGVAGPLGDGYFSVQQSGFSSLPNSMGPNESYDTFDFQNMFLAGLNPNGSIREPSFHRRALASLSPRGDFRAFQRGGPGNDGVVVDNNNDSQPDGIWMDIGLPVENRADGVYVKPVVSYLVVDLDGRINLNAHGSQVRQFGHATSDGSPIAPLSMVPIDLLGMPDPNILTRGQGYGPPEISMSGVLGGSSAIMTGAGGIPGRYGFDGLPGEPNVRDQWSGYKLFGYPNAQFESQIPGTVNRHFSSAMDVHGRFAIGYPDIFEITNTEFPIGMPVADVGFSTLVNEIVDSPYEMSFVEGLNGPDGRGFDQPFTPGELEAVFRQFDLDSQLLPRRLVDLGLSTSSAIHSVTTHSFEVPTTYENLPQKLFQILSDPANGVPSGTDISIELQKMIPPEVFRGLPMDVNRVFGDGVDNNGNGVVDEMAEARTANRFIVHPNGTELDFDHDNDGMTTNDPDAELARVAFARHLYIVTLLTTERVDRNGDSVITSADWYDFNEDGINDVDDLIDFRKVIAQWVSNVIDFRDRDSIMTPCEFDLNPWNGWDVDGSIVSTETLLEGTPQREMRHVCWGAERPELLITETMATHDRRTQDLDFESLANGDSGTTTVESDPDEMADEDFDSHLVPRVSAFFELYNPWVINDANQIRPAELYDGNLDGVDLQKVASGGSPVWRLVVTETGEENLDPDDPTNNESNAVAKTVRRIYFTQPPAQVDTGPEVYYPSANIQSGLVTPGTYAVVGTAGTEVDDRYDTYFGRRIGAAALDADELRNRTRRISLDPINGRVETLLWNPDDQALELVERACVAIPIALNDGDVLRDLGVSDPVGGYFGLTGVGGIEIEAEPIQDGWRFMDNMSDPNVPARYAFDEPVDRMLEDFPGHYDKYLKNDGLASSAGAAGVRAPYRVVHLQRLANPLEAFDQRLNPYRTIDSCGIDLFAFNGVERFADPNNDAVNNPDAHVIRFGSHERRGSPNSEHGQAIGRHRLLFKSDRLGLQNPQQVDANFFNGTDEHVFSWNFIESFASLNTAFVEADPENQKPFCWLTWNNRPYVSQLELANVPHTSSYWMTRLFDISADDNRDVFSPPTEADAMVDNPDTEARNYTAHFPHLLNFYSGTNGAAVEGPSLHGVFDYLEVPSRFVGTESYVNPATFTNNRHDISFGLAAPFDTISNYRYPGKININTVLDPQVWNGLMGRYSATVGYDDWENSRNGSSGAFGFANPYRGSHASNLVPQLSGGAPNQLVVNSGDCGLFRAGPAGPVFDFNPETPLPYADDDRGAYFRYDMRQRLGNLVTNRSSVFAIWITVGYFEVDSNGQLTGANQQGNEAGSETGDVRRHRAFFLFDRSIPVAFEPGQNHNIERAVLVKSIIE